MKKLCYCSDCNRNSINSQMTTKIFMSCERRCHIRRRAWWPSGSYYISTDCSAADSGRSLHYISRAKPFKLAAVKRTQFDPT